jgi:hypothetical protein
MAATTAFNVSTTLPAGERTSPNYAVKPGQTTIQGTMSAGPMSDPTTSVQLDVEWSTDGGNTWVAIGGLDASGGLTGPKGGPYDQPVTASAVTYNSNLSKGDLIRAHAIVVNPPAGGLPVSFVGSVS